MSSRQALVFVLHSSNLYGTERMSLATAQGLADEFESVFLGPPGPALVEAERLGFATGQYRTSIDLAKALRPILREKRALTLVATGPRYSLVCMALNWLYWRRIKHIQMVHAGAGEPQDYGRKWVLNPLNITFVTVSDYARDKLIEYGVRRPIEVVGNFIPDRQIRQIPRRPSFQGPPAKGLMVCRLVPLKRVDLLLDALDYRPELADFSFEIIGEGLDGEVLRKRAGKFPNVRFLGFRPDAIQSYAASDLFIHACPTEAFGLVVLEAMAAHVPVLVPDKGGTALLIDDNQTGFKFKADDPHDLAQRLMELRNADPAQLNAVAANAAAALETRFSEKASLDKYRRLFSLDG
jgi:glycosyltransferase involved in cell wall biosynthesis